jgi:death-on-curing protein
VELSPTIYEKAAALIESILVNHPFVDGNKRTGYGLVRMFLAIHHYEIIASPEDKYKFVIDVSTGLLKFDGILLWMRANTNRIGM